jgi:hypothetical protein
VHTLPFRLLFATFVLLPVLLVGPGRVVVVRGGVLFLLPHGELDTIVLIVLVVGDVHANSLVGSEYGRSIATYAGRGAGP